MSLLSCPPKLPLNPTWTSVLTQKRGIYPNQRERERERFPLLSIWEHPLPPQQATAFLLPINTDWSCGIFSLTLFLPPAAGKAPIKKSKGAQQSEQSPSAPSSNRR